MTTDEDGRRNEAAPGITRRRFLAGTGAGALMVGNAPASTARDSRLLDPRGVEKLLDFHRLAPDRSAATSEGPVLVLLTLYGGNDGLNTVVPLDHDLYAQARGSVALGASSLLPLDADYGLHAGMTGFQALWQAGRLAIIQGVGHRAADLSHFVSMDIWQSAILNSTRTTGWLGRWLDIAPPDPLQAIVIGPVVPLALIGNLRQASAILPPPITLPGRGEVQAAFAEMQTPIAAQSILTQEDTAAGRQFLSIQKQLAPVLDSGRIDTRQLTYAGGSPVNIEAGLDLTEGGGSVGTDSILTEQLNIVAAMIQADLPVKVYSVSLGGFDTHAAQFETHSTLLSQLDTGVSQFLSTMSSNPAGRPVVVFAYSEFGRRVRGNTSLGTDHGEASVAFVAGDGVKGGFYGTAPSLTDLDEAGNLVATTDFRSIYGSVLSSVVGVGPGSILNANFPELPIFG